MEPCTRTPDLFHGRTREQTAALQPPPFQYDRTEVVPALVPPLYRRDADGTNDVLTIRRIAYAENPLSETVQPEDPETILEVWEILDNDDPDMCQGVIFKRRRPATGRVYSSGYDGICEQSDVRRAYLIWEIAVHSQRFGLSSTGWRKRRYPNPPTEW